MDALALFMIIANIQADTGGAVGVKAMTERGLCSRQTTHKWLANLVARCYVRRVGHGKYVINDVQAVLNVAFSTCTPMDIYEHQSKLQIERFSESA